MHDSRALLNVRTLQDSSYLLDKRWQYKVRVGKKLPDVVICTYDWLLLMLLAKVEEV